MQDDQLHTKIAVYGFLLREDKKFLLVQRAASETMPGIWELPGGELEWGEDISSGILREFSEETGLQVLCVRPLSVNVYYHMSEQTKLQKRVIRIAYLTRTKHLLQEIKLSAEHQNSQWHSLADLPVEMLSESTQDVIAHAQKQQIL